MPTPVGNATIPKITSIEAERTYPSATNVSESGKEDLPGPKRTAVRVRVAVKGRKHAFFSGRWPSSALDLRKPEFPLGSRTSSSPEPVRG